MKILKSPRYNYMFDNTTGFFARWGKTLEDNPEMSPFGPEIADIEISTICHGVDNKVCKFCYKNNNPIGKNMSLGTFMDVLSALPSNLTQIAFGIGDIDANPDMWKIFRHCGDNKVVPNVTINGDKMTEGDAELFAIYCGAVAVSKYNPKDICYDAVKALTDVGMKQVNIHMLLAEETYEEVLELIEDIKTDPRLEKLNAVVFLSLKAKGRGRRLTSLGEGKFRAVLMQLRRKAISYGFDSCTANKFLSFLSSEYKEKVKDFVEPCESGLFSIYINVDGIAFPCSFTETGEGIDIKSINNFLEDVWFSKMFIAWRKKLLKNKRNCPVYRI